MKLPFGLLAGAACLSLLFVALPAYSQLAQSKGEESALAKLMDQTKDNMKLLGRSLGGEDLSAPLQHVAELQRLLLLAKLEKPANVDDLEEAEQPAHVLAYRKDMAMTLKVLLDLEIALLDDDKAAAMEMMKGPLNMAKKTGHKRYQKEEE